MAKERAQCWLALPKQLQPLVRGNQTCWKQKVVSCRLFVFRNKNQWVSMWSSSFDGLATGQVTKLKVDATLWPTAALAPSQLGWNTMDKDKDTLLGEKGMGRARLFICFHRLYQCYKRCKQDTTSNWKFVQQARQSSRVAAAAEGFASKIGRFQWSLAHSRLEELGWQ